MTQLSSLSSKTALPEPGSAEKVSMAPQLPTRAKQRPSPTKLSVEAQTQEARQMAAAILEVLAGVRTPTDAAGAIGVSLPRYYALETRALEGLLKACERRPRGPRRNHDAELGKLRREVERLQRECARSQALLRAAQRAVGLRSLEAPKLKGEASGKKHRKRRATARALRAVAILRASVDGGLEPTVEAKHNGGGEKT